MFVKKFFGRGEGNFHGEISACLGVSWQVSGPNRMQANKSLRAAAVICATLVNTHTHTHIRTSTDFEHQLS